jgi:DNA-binding GntR family transcriptional regulator
MRPPLPALVRQSIEEQILTGALKEGDQIVEYRVARQMGISQTPVREALRTLERDGLVETFPHRGTFVRHVTRREAAERYTLGMELEAFAARLALPRLTESDYRTLNEIIDEMAAAAERRAGRHTGPGAEQGAEQGAGGETFARSVELNNAFHRYLVERAGHELLLRAWLAVNPLNWRFVTYTRLLDPGPVELAERHRSLLAAYRTGDQVLAAAAIRQHIWEVAERVLPTIPEAVGPRTANGARQDERAHGQPDGQPHGQPDE